MRKFALLLLTLLLIACGGADESMDHGDMQMGEEGSMSGMEQDIPADLDESLEKSTDNGAFMVELRPMVDPIPLNELHTWELHVNDTDGNPVEGATVTIGGGMPQHNHGFPTEPAVSTSDEAGVYLVEGMKYQMSGWWEMDFEIASAETSDSVTFNIILP